MLWIKEVEMVESVDDLKSSRSIKRNSWSRLWVARREDCFSGYKNSGRISPTKVLQQSIGETESKEVKTLPVSVNCGYEESRREQARLHKKTGATRKKHFERFRSEVFMKWVNWKELRNCELTNSLYKKLTQSHDTIQQLTSQIQELQEMVNCMNDSGEFQEKESNYNVTFSHVPSQPAVVPSPRSMLSRDQATWYVEFVWDRRKRFWQSTCNIRVITDTLSRNSSLSDGSKGQPVARGEERIGRTTPMPMTAGRPSTMNSSLPVEIPQNSMAVQQRLQISELQFGKFPHLQCYSCWKIKFKTQVSSCSDFHSDAARWIKEVRWSVQWMNNPRDQLRVRISRILKCWTRELLQHWTKSSRIPASTRRSVSRSRKPKKRTDFLEEDRSPSWSTTTFESLVPMIQFLIMLIYSLSFFEPMVSRNSIRDGMKFYCLWPRSRLTTFWKVCTNWEFVSLINAKPYKNCTTWKFIRRYRCPDYQKLKTMVKRSIGQKFRWENFDARHGKIWLRNSGQESNEEKWRWRRKRYLLPVDRKRSVFERRLLQFPPRDWRSCPKTRTHCRHTFWVNRITRCRK